VVQCGHLSDKGGVRVLQMQTFALFGAKNSGFFEVYGMSARTRGRGEVEPVRTFFGQEWRGSIFAILCGRLLWTTPNCISKSGMFFHIFPQFVMFTFISQFVPSLVQASILKLKIP